MRYSDVTFFDKNHNIIFGDIEAENGIVTSINKKGEGRGKPVLPPFVDIHIHGGYGVDIMGSKREQIIYLSQKLYEDNVGAFMPTTVAKSYDEILYCAEEIKKASKDNTYSEILGIHIEGPFISKEYKGIMEEKYISQCDTRLYDSLKSIMGDLKIRFTVAPECEGAEEFCRYVVKNGDYVSIGHSGGNREDCLRLTKAGASSYTHIFNAMSPIHHRNMGVSGAGLIDDSFVEVICDFVHLSKECIRLILRCKENKIILITDAISAMGCGKGSYIFCGKNVYADDFSVRDKSGRLAGSILSMKSAVSNMAEIAGIGSAINMGCENPSRLLHLEKYGYIDIGKRIIL